MKLDSSSRFVILIIVVILILYAISNKTSEPYSGEVNKTNETSEKPSPPLGGGGSSTPTESINGSIDYTVQIII